MTPTPTKEQQMTKWLLDNPEAADKVRNLLCTDTFVAKEAAKRIAYSPEIFWLQVDNQMTSVHSDAESHIESLLTLKRFIESSVITATISAAQGN
jgi:hypothetical protein